MGIAITYAIPNLAVLGNFFYVTYRITRKSKPLHEKSIKKKYS